MHRLKGSSQLGWQMPEKSKEPVCSWKLDQNSRLGTWKGSFLGTRTVQAGRWSWREDNGGVCFSSGSADCGFWKKNGKSHTGTTHCIKCGFLFSSAFHLSLGALFKFAALVVLLKCCTNGAFQRLLECFFSIQGYFKLKFVLVCGHVPPSRTGGLDWVSSWPLAYCTKCPKYPQVFIFLESSN